MAAESLLALGHPAAIDPAWGAASSNYAGALPRRAPLDPSDDVGLGAALGDLTRLGDWLDLFRRELARRPWRAVVASWVPRLAPGAAAALFHGLIRTAHVTRALQRRETEARRGELAAALAYWSARYTTLAVAADLPTPEVALASLPFLWVDDVADVPFDRVHERLSRTPSAPPVDPARLAGTPDAALEVLVVEAAASFLEMLAAERHRIWLLHAVTGPAAAALLLPHLDGDASRMLVAHSRQAVVALFTTFGAPHRVGAHLRDRTEDWGRLTTRAAESRSVHTIKLVEALARYRHVDDALCRSVAATWFDWK
jgi:hypothetical protein